MSSKLRMLAVFTIVLILKANIVLAEESVVLKLEDLVKVVDQHPALKIANTNTKIAEAEIGITRQYPNPEISASIGVGRAIDSSDSALIWGVELEIPIDAPGAYVKQTAAAKEKFRAEKYLVLAKRIEILRQIKGIGFKVAIGQEMLRVKKDSMEQILKLVEIAKLRVQHGEARAVEVARLEIEKEKMLAEVVAFEKNLLAMKSNLNLWFGGKFPTTFEVEANWKDFPSLISVEDAVQLAKDQHPSIKASKLKINAAIKNTKAEKHLLMPEMKLGAFYGRELDAHNYGGMLSVELPVWNWQSGSIAKAQAEELAARYRKTLLERELVEDIQTVHAEASQSIGRAKRYSERILPIAKKNVEDIEAMYSIGEMDLIDVLDARRNLIETETNMLAAFYQGWLSYLDLMMLMGEENE